VKKPNLAIELSSYAEQQNMWIGPRQVSSFLSLLPVTALNQLWQKPRMIFSLTISSL